MNAWSNVRPVTGSFRRWAALLLLPLVLLLSGCLKLETNFKISADDRVTGSMLVAIQQKYASLIRDTCDPTSGSNGVLPPGAISPYNDGNYVGCTIKFSGPASVFSHSSELTIRHENGQYLFAMRNSSSTGANGAGTSEVTALMFDSFKVAVTFPGEVLSHNGSSTVTGTTVTWTDPADMLSRDGLRATSKEASPLAAALPWALPTAGALLVLGLAVVGWVLVRRRREAAVSTPQVMFGSPTQSAYPTFFDPTEGPSVPGGRPGDPSAPPRDPSGPGRPQM